MRFKSREDAVKIIRTAIDHGINYIDTAPEYRLADDIDNSESWIGEAISKPGYRERLILTSKSSPYIYGKHEKGADYFRKGKGIDTADKSRRCIEQSLKRLKQDKLDAYHMWCVHDADIFRTAMSPGGWFEGVIRQKDKWRWLGITSHGDADTIIQFLKTGIFSFVTIPLNVINRTRLAVVEYCKDKDIRVLAMNPFAGGFLAANDRLRELALNYLLKLENVTALIGFNRPEEVDYAVSVLNAREQNQETAEDILEEVNSITNITDEHCTACGYCAPCPQGINLGECLSLYNHFKYMNDQNAKKYFLWKQWDDFLRLDHCIECMSCKEKCSNKLPLEKIIPDAKKLLYS
ncbi:MAG: aldo/keto reductase [Deltaproteobacteria bacterium]|nr:aldo/keto reductase [Deltaproteobacteria bacterium]